MRLLPASLSPSAAREAQEFAELLDGSRTDANPALAPLVACAATLRPAPLDDVLPSAQFRAQLRATLVEGAAARAAAPTPGRPSAATRRDLDWGTPQRPHRLRTAVAGGLLVAMLGGAGASWASSRALPGDALYGLKRGLENTQLDLARSDTAQGRELLEQAEHRLSEAEALASSESAREPATRARISGALTDMDTAAAAGAEELTQAYRDTGDPEPLRLLDRFATDQRERLDDLAALLDPSLQARVRSLTAALAALQARVETLLPGGAGAALGAGSVLAAASAAAVESGDGWAVSRVFNEVTGAAPVSAGDVQARGAAGPAAPRPGPGGGGTVGDPVDGVGKVVGDVVDDATKAAGDVVGGVTGTGSGSGGGGGGGGGGGAVPLPTVTLPPVGGSTPVPTVTLPTLPPPPSVSLPPVSVPPLPSVSLPAGSQSGLPCVPVPPVTHC